METGMKSATLAGPGRWGDRPRLTAIALSPLGDRAFVALSDGRIIGLNLA